MCYPPPGPRCSSHANAEWLKTLALLEKETDANRLIRLQMKADEALRAFNSTPRGQNRLLRSISALANTPENKDEIAKLSLQLRDGQLTRKNQFDAFLAVKNNKETSIKKLLQTSNKQKQAVGIAFHVLMKFLPETIGDTTHIVSDNLIQVGDMRILCLPQKHQRYFGSIKEEGNGYLSSADLPVELLDIFADFSESSTITPNYIPQLTEWFVSQLKSQGIKFLAIVDVKTENVIFSGVDALSEHYDVSFTQKRKLGGTAPYIHGATEILRDSIAQTPLDGCEITVATVQGQKRTYILDAPYLEPHERQSLFFYFTEKLTSEGSRFYEVRTRHQSSQKEVLIKLSRKSLVISKTDEGLIKRFILEYLGSSETVDFTK